MSACFSFRTTKRFSIKFGMRSPYWKLSGEFHFDSYPYYVIHTLHKVQTKYIDFLKMRVQKEKYVLSHAFYEMSQVSFALIFIYY
jgi:hypothetical protein